MHRCRRSVLGLAARRDGPAPLEPQPPHVLEPLEDLVFEVVRRHPAGEVECVAEPHPPGPFLGDGRLTGLDEPGFAVHFGEKIRHPLARNRELGAAVDLPVHIRGGLLRHHEVDAEIDSMAARQEHSVVVGRRGGLEPPDPQKGLQRGPRDPMYHMSRAEERALAHPIHKGRTPVVAEHLHEEAQHFPADAGRVFRSRNGEELAEVACIAFDVEAPASEGFADALDESAPALIELVCSDLEHGLPRGARPDLHVEKEAVVAPEVEDQEAEISYTRLEVQAILAPLGSLPHELGERIHRDRAESRLGTALRRLSHDQDAFAPRLFPRAERLPGYDFARYRVALAGGALLTPNNVIASHKPLSNTGSFRAVKL